MAEEQASENITQIPITKYIATKPKLMVCYYPKFFIDSIPENERQKQLDAFVGRYIEADLCSHLIYAFVTVSENGAISEPDPKTDIVFGT